MGGRLFTLLRYMLAGLLVSIAGCSEQSIDGIGSGDGSGSGEREGTKPIGQFGTDRQPQGIVDGFAVTIDKIGGGDIEISWASQSVSDYEVWASADPYFVPGESGSSMVASGSSLSYVDDEGGELYYRVVAEGATEELSTTVGQLTYDLYRFYTKLGLCLISDIDTWPELDADMPSNPSSASMWIPSNQSWRVPPALNTTVFGPGQVISVQHTSNPSPTTYTAIGHVPTEEDVSIPLYVGDNLVTTVPMRFGPIMASDLLEQVEGAERIGRWDAATQTLYWYPAVADFLIPTCSPVHVDMDATGSWPPPSTLPPDPSEVAPPLDPTVTTAFASQVSFLWDAEEPIQTGVDEEVFEAARLAVLRGRVLDELGDPLPGVEVTVKDHPEFGGTLSREDGWYDLGVNGGGWLTVNLRLDEHVPAQRTVRPGWQQFSYVDDVVLVERDAVVTLIEFTDPIEVALGSEVEDADGTRQPALLFVEDTVATMHMPGGGTELLSAISVRMTEATVGELGPQRMIADLPVASMYTYAIDYSIDEAIEEGAESVSFDPPAISYTENFVGFPVGEVVPVGSYDMSRAGWIPETNGVVLEVVSETAGLADLDLDGDGNAENSSAYAAAGISDDERETVADLYVPGDELWRVEVDHFSTWDSNWGFSPPPDATDPPDEGPDDPEPEPDSCEVDGSILECQGQVMGERLPIAGTPFTLNYRSDRVPGRTAAYTLTLPISGPNVSNILGIDLRVIVAGKLIQEEFDVIASQDHSVTWDGLDVYGRRMQGPARADVCLAYRYGISFNTTSGFGYNGNGSVITGDRSSATTQFWRCYARNVVGGGVVPADPFARLRALGWNDGYVLGIWDARAASPALGGWTLDVHHTVAREAETLYLGDGSRRTHGKSYLAVMKTIAGGGSSSSTGIPATDATFGQPQALAQGPDGSIYVGLNGQVRRIDPDGVLQPFAGTGAAGFSGDGGAATSAQVGEVHGIAVAADRSVYLADWSNRRVRRVDADGIITTVIGNGTTGTGGDGGPASSASVTPLGLAVASDGTLYIGQGDRVRRVDPDGTISRYVGGTCTSGLPDGKAADADCVCNVWGIALSANDDLYFTANPLCSGGVPATAIYRIDARSNEFVRVAGQGTPVDGVGDGFPATDARLFEARGVAVSPEGNVYITERSSGGGTFPDAGRRVRVVERSGLIRTLAGCGSCTDPGESSPAPDVFLNGPDAVLYGLDHAVYVTHGTTVGRVGRVSTAGVGFGADSMVVPSGDERELYVFAADGRHEATLDALTGTTLLTFGYDGEGRLETVTDLFAAVTTIERDGNGEATAIVSPDGQETTLVVPEGGYLESVTNPEGETHAFEYTAAGLLTSHTTPRLDEFVYDYDAGGRLISASDPEGGSKTLVRTVTGAGEYEIAMTTELGRTSAYQVSLLGGTKTYTNTAPDGSSIVTQQYPDGSSRITYPDNTTAISTTRPDPRFGMETPLATVTTSTPGGRERVESWGRSATLATAGDPLSMTDLVSTYTVNGHTWTWTWDGAADTIVMESPEGRVATTGLDGSGRIATAEVATLAGFVIDYDARGRPTLVTQGTGGTAREVDLAYGTDGFVESVTDPLARTQAFSRDLVGRIVARTRPDTEVIATSYDDNGNVDGITPASQPEHAFSYDATDRLASYDPPVVTGVSSPSTTYDYSLDHEIELITRPDAQEIEVVYDATTGQPLTVVTPLGTYGIAYDAAERVEVLSDPDGGSLTYAYDGPLVLSETIVGDVDGAVSWTYDDDFRIASQSVNGSSTVSFGYDDDGITVAAGAATLVPDPTTGLVTDIVLGDVDTTLTWSEFAEPSDLTYTYDATTIFDVSYVRDALGRIESFEETIGATTREVEYGYDVVGRLETVTIDSSLVATYEYDDNGNRTAVIGGATVSATYDDQDRLLTFGDFEYEYTAAGELVSRTDTVTTDVTLYDYDVVGNLRSVELSDSTVIEYVTDARGRRVGKSVDGLLQRGWLYGDQLQIVAELDDESTLVSRFVYADEAANVPLYMVRGGTTYRLVADHLGSVRLVVDVATGTVAQRLDYDPWGVVLTDTNPGFQPFGFAGGLYDPDTDLVRYGARDYDAQVGRWTSRDPILFNGGDENLFAYVHADPVNFVDPTGNAGVGVLVTPAGLAAIAAAYAAAAMWADCVDKGICKPLSPPKPPRRPSAAPCPEMKPGIGDAMKHLADSFSKRRPFDLPEPPKNRPRSKECDKEWEEAIADCAEILSPPPGKRTRPLAGGHKDILGCAKGLVSAYCGGNPV